MEDGKDTVHCQHGRMHRTCQKGTDYNWKRAFYKHILDKWGIETWRVHNGVRHIWYKV